jgi:hypothetical protein
MPIVELKSTAYDSMAGNVLTVVDNVRSRAGVRCAVGSVANGSGDSSGSLYRLWRMPAGAILRPETRVDLQTWGYAAVKLGIARADGAVLDDDGLLASATVAGLSAASAPIAQFGAKWNKPVWEAAGLAANPGGLIDVVILTVANATGAGSAKFDAVWQVD